MRRALLLGSLAASLFAPNALAYPAKPTVANLDADRPWERLAISGDVGRDQRVTLVDRCRGKLVTRRLAGRWDTVDWLQVRELDGATKRPEIFIDARRGAGGHLGVIKVVRYTGTGCPQPRTLFRYSGGASGAANFSVTVRNWVHMYPGKEIRLEEEFMEPGDVALCCPSTDRFTFFRYSRQLGRYTAYLTFKRPNDVT